MDPNTAYSYLRVALPAGARIRTEGPNTSGVMVFTVTDEAVTVQGHLSAESHAVLIPDDGITDVWPHFPGYRVGPAQAIALAKNVAREWRDAQKRRPKRLETLPERGQVLLGHPDDVRMLERAAKLGHLPYMLSRYSPLGMAVIIDAGKLGFIPPPDVRDPRGLFGTTGLVI